MSVASTSVAAARGAGRTLDYLLERPVAVLGTLVGAQIAATIVLALTVTHNGWVYFQGGDQIVNTTTGWLLGRLELPPTEVGYMWPLVQAPITWFTGATFLQALPPLLFLNVLVLGPAAVLSVYGIAAHIGGRLLGYWAATLWVIAPFAAIPMFVDRYHEKWVDHFLPQAVGLTAMPDYPSMVLVLVAAYFVVRSLEPGHLLDAILAGLLVGAAGGMKPPNYLFAAGAVLAYPLARRWREGIAFGLAIVPGLVLLAYWKWAGLGELPALAMEQTRLAAGATPLALDVDRYLELNVEHWRQQMNELREFFWSARVAQWAPFAGLLAVLRVRRYPLAGLLAGWLAAFIVVKGFSTRASIEANTFWRLLMPAWPAYLLLFASIPLLLPTLARRLGERLRPPEGRTLTRRAVIVAAVLTLAIPAVTIAASSPTDSPDRAVFQDDGENFILTAVEDDVELSVSRVGEAQELHMDGGRSVARERLLSRLPLVGARDRHRVRALGRRTRPVLLPALVLDRDHPRDVVRRPGARRGRHVPHRGRHELGGRRRAGRRLRVQSRSDGCSVGAGDILTTLSSSSATRCASSMFSSVSFEMTVE